MFVGRRQIGLVVAVGRADDLGGGEAAAIGRAGVAAGELIRVRGVLVGVVATLELAVGGVDGVEEVVEGAALQRIADLVQRDALREDERPGVLEVEVGLGVECVAFQFRLDDPAVDRLELGSEADGGGGEVAEEGIEIVLGIGMWRVFDDAEGIARGASRSRWGSGRARGDSSG